MPEGIFTTARVSGGRILRRALHRARLLHDGGAPELVDALLLEGDRQAAALVEGMARLLLVVEGGRVVARVETGPARRSAWAPGDPPLRLITRLDPRPPEGPFVKSLDRASFAPLEEEARALGADGVLLEGPEGLREGTWFHVAVLAHGVWRTPPVGPGVLYGTTRAAFLAAARARGDRIEECPLSRAHLEQAEGMLALSSLLGMAAVSHVDEAALPVIGAFPLPSC